MLSKTQVGMVLFPSKIFKFQPLGTVISELGSDNVNEKKVMQFADKFLKGLDEVENELNRQLSYLGQVTCNTTHEGSVYGRVRENDHMLTAIGSALLRSKHLMELTAPDKCPVQLTTNSIPDIKLPSLFYFQNLKLQKLRKILNLRIMNRLLARPVAKMVQVPARTHIINSDTTHTWHKVCRFLKSEISKSF